MIPEPTTRRGRPPLAIADDVADEVLQQVASLSVGRFDVPAIARAAGVHRSTVYRRWPSDADLLDLALARVATRIAARAPLAASDPGQVLRSAVELLSGPGGRALAVARIAAPSRRPADRQADDPTLDLLVGAVIHRLFVVGRPCTPDWQRAVLATITPSGA